MKSKIVDQKFVITAAIIAIIYTCIVVFINKIVGKEAAGIAGVALTALATAIFKQFENLKFKGTSTTPTTISMQFRWYQVILIAFLFSGISRILVELMESIIPLVFHAKEPYMQDFGQINGKLINHYSIWEQTTKCLSYMLCGIIATKAFKRISYSVIVTAALFGVIIDFYTETLWYILFDDNTFDLESDLDDYKYSIVWIIFSFIGSYLSQFKKNSLS